MAFFKKTVFALPVVLAALAGCSDSGPRPPSLNATIRPMSADEKADPNHISAADLLAIAGKAKKMSCLELQRGQLEAFVMSSIADPNLVNADASTRAIAGAVGPSSTARIEAEEKCHCDDGQAMPGYELYERRTELLKTKNASSINPDLAAFYPKDQTGQPRFLRYGEDLPDTVLTQLPPAPVVPRYDDCGSDCKASRAKTNAEAVAAGKPEPWPDLLPPKKLACTKASAPVAKIKNKTVIQ